MHGNTVKDHVDAVRAVVWNSMQLAAGRESAKRAWLAEQLDLFRPTVVVLLEVSGDFDDMKKLRKWAAKLKYDMRFMVGEDAGPGGSRRNGMVALVAREQAAFRSHKRQEERVMGFVVTHKVDAATRAYVGLHGSHDKVKQAKQFDAATKFAAEHGGALLAADWNAVPCQKWRATESKLDGSDRKLRKICGKACSCCGRGEEARCKVVGGAGGDFAEEDASVSFTRWHIAEGKWVKPTARLDFVVATGLEEGKWTLLDEVRAEWGAEEEQPRPYSDHVMIVVEREAAAALGREKRPVAVARGNTKLAKMTRQRLLERSGVDTELVVARAKAARLGESGTDAVTRTLVSVGREEMEAARREIEEDMKRKPTAHANYNDWKARLQLAKDQLDRGLDVRRMHELGVGLMHVGAGLRKFVERADVSASSQTIWRRIIRHARRCRRRAGVRVFSEQKQWTKEVIKASEERENDDAKKRHDRTWRALKASRASTAMEFMHEGDDASKPKVSCAEAEFQAVSAQIGQACVAKLSRPTVVSAARAWLRIFVGNKEELKGMHGGKWELEEELSFDVFVSTLYAMPKGKAVGMSGFSVELLRTFAKGGREQEEFYEAIMGDLKRELIPASWKVVIYALLVKPPPNNPAIVAERREIAIMDQLMKTVEKATQRRSYDRMSGRVLNPQMGWLQGCSVAHVGIQLETLIQASVRLKRPMWVLYADMQQFFPSLDRQLLRMHEIAAGVPEDVLDLAAAIYGRGLSESDGTACRYDSAAGLGGTFKITVGALMGSIWSTGKAKFFVQSVVAAILMKAKGPRLWGGAPQTHGEAWERLLEFIFADDLAAAFTCVEELRLAWDIFLGWTTFMGQKLGVKGILKTACTATAFSKQGIGIEAKDPKLRMPAGSKDAYVPFFQADKPYKHLGSGRRLDGVCTDAIAKITAGCKHAMRMTRKMRSINQEDFCRVADVLLNGKVQWHNQTTYLTWKEADGKVEAPFRAEYNRRYHRVGSSARVQLYQGVRRHAWATALSSMLTVIAECLSEAEDTQPRRAVRAAVAMALADWGCEGDPFAWNWRHLRHALEESLERKVRPIGEVFMLAVVVAMEHEGKNERPGMPWALVKERLGGGEGMLETDPLHHERQHFWRSQSRRLFEPTANGGLGIAPEESLLKAGLRAVGHFCTFDDDGEPRWFESVDEAATCHKHLKAGARERLAWARVMEVLRSETAPAEPEEDRHVSRGIEDAAESSREKARAKELKALAKERAKLVAAAEAEARGDATPRDSDEWEAWLREAYDHDGPAADATFPEWDAGTVDVDEMAAGPRIFFDMKRKVPAFGGEARWLQRSIVGTDGYVKGWQKTKRAMLRHLEVNAGGWVCDERTKKPLSIEEAEIRGPGVEMVVRARHALGEHVRVIDEPVAKDTERHDTFVNRQAVEQELQRLATWTARTGAGCVISMDGCRKDAEGGRSESGGGGGDDEGEGVKLAGWAAQCSDGGEWHGVLTPPYNDNYMAEMRAQIAVAERCKCRRIVLVFDATSPPEVLRRFIWSCTRKRQRIYRRDWIDNWWDALQKFETVVFLWQTSHAGAPSNEWADVAADIAASSCDIDDVQFDAVKYATVEWLQADGQLVPRGIRDWATRLLQKAALKRLQETSASTQLASADDMALKPLKPSEELLAEEIRSARAQIGDAKRFWGQASKVQAAAHACPFECGCAFRWSDVAFKCQGAPVKVARAEWIDATQRAFESLAMPLETSNPSRQGWALLRSRLAGEGGKLKVDSEAEVTLRRMTGGLFRRSGKKELDSESWARKLVERVRCAGLRLQELGRQTTTEFEENMRKDLKNARSVSRWAYKWMARVIRAGPQRAAWLRELQRARIDATSQIDNELGTGSIGAVEASGRMARVECILEFGKSACAREIKLPESTAVALRRWARLAMCCRWRRRALGRDKLVDEPVSKIRAAALAAAWGGSQHEASADILSGSDVQKRELRARAWWRRGGGHDPTYTAKLDRWEIQAGRRSDSQGRWSAEVVSVRRPEKRVGLQLEVQVRYGGTDAEGNAWPDKWVAIRDVTNDLKVRARYMEEIRYPKAAKPASRPAGRRYSPRLEVIYEREEEKEESERQRAWTDYAAMAAAEAAGM